MTKKEKKATETLARNIERANQDPTPEFFLMETYGVNTRIAAEGTREDCQNAFKTFSTAEAQRISTTTPRPQYTKRYTIKSKGELYPE